MENASLAPGPRVLAVGRPSKSACIRARGRSVLGDGARLDTLVAQEQQCLRLFLRAECVEPFGAL